MSRVIRPTRVPRRAGLAAGAAVAALALTGCGTGVRDTLVGIQPAPSESAAAAPLDPEGAAAVAARVLGEAEKASTAPGAAGAKARAAVMTGDARLVADARAARATPSTTPPRLTRTDPPTVVAQSSGREWPRAILAATLDRTTSTQYLHVLVSADPASPYLLRASVPMFPGATLPAIGAEGQGAELVPLTVREGVVAPPATALNEYAAALRQPSPVAPKNIAITDPFATGLRTSGAAQAKALGTLGAYTQAHAPAVKDAIAFRLADGGVVAFTRLDRTDTFTAKPTAKELVLPPEYAKLVGKPKVTTSAKVQAVQPVVLVVPPSGKASVIGAAEVLTTGTGA